MADDPPQPGLEATGEEEQSSGKEGESTEKSGGLKGVIISACFTLLGVIIGVLGKGGFDVALEEKKFVAEQKLDADLVKLALQFSGIDKGGDTLGFMVDTNLITDPDIKKGVKAYLDAKKPISVLKGSILTNPGDVTALEEAVAARVVARSQDGKLGAIAERDGTIELLDVKKSAIIDRKKIEVEGYPPLAFSFSPDSSKLLYVSPQNLVLIWNVMQRKFDETAAFKLPDKPDSAGFSTDSQFVAIGRGNEVTFYDDHGKVYFSGPK